MNSLLVLAYRLWPVLLLLACAGGGGAGGGGGGGGGGESKSGVAAGTRLSLKCMCNGNRAVLL